MKLAVLILALALNAGSVFALPVCDGATDDTAALNALFASGHPYGWAVLPSGKVCLANGALLLNASYMGVDFAGSSIHSTVTSGAALTVTSGQNSYNSMPIMMPRIWGDSHAGTIGLLVAGNHIIINEANINGFATGVQLGDYAYSDDFRNPYIYSASTAFSCPSGVTGAGEQIVIDSGSLFNSSNGISNLGGCNITVHGTSIDAITNLPIDNEHGGQFIADGIHVEMFATLPGPWIKNTNCNAFGFVEIDRSQLYSDNQSGIAFIENDGSPPCGGSGTWAKVKDSFFSGFPNGPAVSGTTPLQVTLCGNTSGAGGGTMNNIANRGGC